LINFTPFSVDHWLVVGVCSSLKNTFFFLSISFFCFVSILKKFLSFCQSSQTFFSFPRSAFFSSS
jgi:hypothetical protein